MKKTEIVFFDMEGTIFKKVVPLGETNVAPSAWFAIAQSLGSKALEEEQRTQVRWNNKKYSSYIEWMEDTIRIHKKYKLKKETFCKILDAIEYTLGVKEVFSVINRKGIPTALVSGGFKYQADRAVRELKFNHSFVSCEYFWDSKGFLEHWNLLPGDYQGKLDFMKLLIKEYGFSKEKCVFIGDGDNDVALAKYAGISIAFNASEKLRKKSTYSINQDEGNVNFRSVLKYLKFD